MSPIIAKLARIASPALKLMTLLILAVTAWMGVSVEINTAPTTVSQGTVAYSIGGVGRVYAATDTTNTKKEAAPTWSANDTESIALGLINSFIDLLFILFNPILFLAGWLLTPDWVFGEVFGFRPVLHQFWVLISNIVYVIFAFLLVGIAFMNIFGSEQSAWQMKTKLPKLIIGIISVPFTWFFVSAITSIASVLTASVIQIPGDMITDKDTKAITINVPTKCSIDFTKSATNQKVEPAAAGATGTAAAGKSAKDGMFNCESPAEWKGKTLGELFKSESAYGILTAYAYGIYKFQDVKVLNGSVLGSIKNIKDISMGLLIAVIFFFVFLLLIVALVFALFTRGVMLWIYAIFSPLLSLSYFFEWKLPGGLDDKFGITKVISLAMVPVFVAAALSFGMLFLQMAQSVDIDTSNSQYVKPATCAAGWENCTAYKFTDTTIEVTGVPVGMTKVLNGAKHFGLSAIGQLMINVLGLIVLWIAVMAALKSNKITEEAVKPVAEFGESIGKLMKSIPKMIPIIPTPHGPMGLQGLSRMGENFASEIRNSAGNVGAELGTKWGQAAATAMGNKSNDPRVSELRNGLSRLDWLTSKADIGAQMTTLLKGIAEKKTLNELAGDPAYRGLLSEWVGKISTLKKEEKEKLQEDINSGDIGRLSSALHKLETHLGDGVLGGKDADFGTPEKTKAWFEAQKNAAKTAETAKKTEDATPTSKLPNLGRVLINVQDKNIHFTAPDEGEDKPAVNVSVDIKDSKISNDQLAKAVKETGLSESDLVARLKNLGITKE